MWVLYDFPNEKVFYCDEGYMPTERMMVNNIVKMSAGQAAAIRKAKGLPMPSPPVATSFEMKAQGLTK